MEYIEIIQRFDKLLEDKARLEGEQFIARVNTVLDRLISLGYWEEDSRSPQLPAEHLIRFIKCGCKQLKSSTILLKSKYAQTVEVITGNKRLDVPEEVLNLLVDFLLTSLQQSKQSPLASNFLVTLATALKGNGPLVEKKSIDAIFNISGPVLANINFREVDYVTQGEAIQCLGNLCVKASNELAQLDKIFVKFSYQKVVDHLKILLTFYKEKDIEFSKLVSKTVKALQSILSVVQLQDGIVESEFTLALLRIFYSYGLPGFSSTVSHLIKNLPSLRNDPLSTELKTAAFAKCEKFSVGKQVFKKKRRGKSNKNKSASKTQDMDEKDNNSPSVMVDSVCCGSGDLFNISYTEDGMWLSSHSSSESEFSDSERSHLSKLKSIGCHIRQNALKCTQGILRCTDKREKLSCWLFLVPETFSELEPSLLSTFMNDPSLKVRIMAQTALIELMNSSKPYLDPAVSRSSNQAASSQSFLPFSVKLNQSLILLHETLVETAKKQCFDQSTDRLLQCLTVLVLNTPYDKIGNEILYQVCVEIPKFLNAVEPNIIISALTCLAAVMSVCLNSDRISEILTDISYQSLRKSSSSQGLVKPFQSWFVSFCYNHLEHYSHNSRDTNLPENLINQCLQVLKVVMQTYPTLVLKAERELIIQLVYSKFITTASDSMSFHGVKLLEEFGKYFAKVSVQHQDEFTEALCYWKRMLPGPIAQLLQASPHIAKLQSAGCDWLSTIGPEVFESLEYRMQILCKTMLLGISNDEENIVRSSSIRALGVLVTYPFVVEDASFVMDVGTSVFRELKSSSVGVRIKAAWSLANISDSLVKNFTPGLHENNSDISDAFVLDMLTASTSIALDADKVKSNGVRAIGNVLRWIPKSLVENSKFLKPVSEAGHALSRNISTGLMKTRWNSCYASSNLFQNQYLLYTSAEWINEILTALAQALRDCKNFKVRIGAAVALSTLKERVNYGTTDQYFEILSMVVEALQSSEELSDFTEFKFKDTLQEKICILLCHLLCRATEKDNTKIKPYITQQQDFIHGHISRFSKDVQNEESSEMVETCTNSKERKNEDLDSLIENLKKLDINIGETKNLREVFMKLVIG